MNLPMGMTQLPGTDPPKATVRAVSTNGRFLGEWKIRSGDSLTLTFSSEYEVIAKQLFEEVKRLKKKIASMEER